VPFFVTFLGKQKSKDKMTGEQVEEMFNAFQPKNEIDNYELAF
jgi:hypothetical protein